MSRLVRDSALSKMHPRSLFYTHDKLPPLCVTCAMFTIRCEEVQQIWAAGGRVRRSSIILKIVLGILTVVCKGEAYPDGFTNCSAPHHSRSSVPHTMTGGIGEDLDGFPKLFVVTAVPGGVKIRGSRIALGDQWQNCSMVLRAFLVIAHLPSRAVSVGACHKSPLRQRHLSLRKHLCLRKTQRLHHFRITHQKHQCSARDIH